MPERNSFLHCFGSKVGNPGRQVFQKLIDRTEALKAHPYIGQSEPLLEAIGQQSRYIVEGNYKIIYQVESREVIVTDIFHTKQNPIKLVARRKKEE